MEKELAVSELYRREQPLKTATISTKGRNAIRYRNNRNIGMDIQIRYQI
jgi:hypothetical protein